MGTLIVQVNFQDFDANSKEDKENAKELKKSVYNYIERFNKLPNIGEYFLGSSWGPAKVEYVSYGVDHVFVHVSFDN